MNASTLKNHKRNQKKQGNTERRKQAKQEIDKALDARATDFAEDARKINELYGKYAAINDANGFAEAVIDYAGKSQCLVGHITEFRAIIDGRRYLAIPGEVPTPQQVDEPIPVEAASEAYDREQKSLEFMNREFQKLIRKIS